MTRSIWRKKRIVNTVAPEAILIPFIAWLRIIRIRSSYSKRLNAFIAIPIWFFGIPSIIAVILYKIFVYPCSYIGKFTRSEGHCTQIFNYNFTYMGRWISNIIFCTQRLCTRSNNGIIRGINTCGRRNFA